MNFINLNWAGWTLIILQGISLLLAPWAMGKERRAYSYSDFITTVIATVILLIALHVI